MVAEPAMISLPLSPNILDDLRSSGISDIAIAKARIRPASSTELARIYAGKRTAPSGKPQAPSAAESFILNLESDLFAAEESSSPLDALDNQPVDIQTLGVGINPASIINSNPEANIGGLKEAYVIPYFSTRGEIIREFYRYKLLPPLLEANGKPRKYLQLKGQKNHAYLPPTIAPHTWADTHVPIIITEGEKKALSCSQYGHDMNIATMAIGGVDSWRNRIVEFDADAIIDDRKGRIKAKVKSAAQIRELEEQVAEELLEIPWANRKVYIIYDTDSPPKAAVQRAAFELALFLEEHGAIPVQVMLPSKQDKKVGLDDFIVENGWQALDKLIKEGEWKFPPLPEDALKGWIQKQLNSGAKRSTYQRVARAVLANMDTQGRRFKDTGRGYYFFENRTKALHAFFWDSQEVKSLRLATMGTHLMNNYGIGTSDSMAISRIGDQFTALEPLVVVKPRHVVTTEGDALYFQLSSSRLIKVDADSIQFCDNGTDEMLFVAGEVQDLDQDLILKHLQDGKIADLWLDTLSETSIEAIPGLTLERTHKLLACVYHLNPWFRRWRGLMLPIEIIEAEPGSGKTFVMNLRRGLLVGTPTLDNAPTDIKDWYATIADAPAMWVCDNLGDNLDRKIRDKISDELARLTTEPDPSVAMRELFTTSAVATVKIDCTYAVTTIRSPFHKPDVLQRSLIYHMHSVPAGMRDGLWYERKIREREKWIAEHLLVAQRFFQLVRSKWDDKYMSGHRLMHFEQALLCMGEALGFGVAEMQEIIAALPEMTQAAVAKNDPMSEALLSFVEEYPIQYPNRKIVELQAVIDWAQMDLEARYTKLYGLGNSVLLGRYLAMYQTQVRDTTGIELTKKGGKSLLVLHGKPQSRLEILEAEAEEKKS